MEILLVILQYLLPVLGSVLTVVLVALAKKLLDKWNIERGEKIDRMLDDYVGKGVAAAEKAAANYLKAKNGKMTGGQKKVKAVRVVMRELEQAGVTNVAEELVSERIEAWLSDDKKPNAPSPTGETS